MRPATSQPVAPSGPRSSLARELASFSWGANSRRRLRKPQTRIPVTGFGWSARRILVVNGAFVLLSVGYATSGAGGGPPRAPKTRKCTDGWLRGAGDWPLGVPNRRKCMDFPPPTAEEPTQIHTLSRFWCRRAPRTRTSASPIDTLSRFWRKKLAVTRISPTSSGAFHSVGALQRLTEPKRFPPQDGRSRRLGGVAGWGPLSR